jgi:hypothetical protein
MEPIASTIATAVKGTYFTPRSAAYPADCRTVRTVGDIQAAVLSFHKIASKVKAKQTADLKR